LKEKKIQLRGEEVVHEVFLPWYSWKVTVVYLVTSKMNWNFILLAILKGCFEKVVFVD
jgi:hypothetical protein